MPTTNKRFLFAAILAAGVFLPGALPAETKTLKRVDDPIVMEGREFSSLLHHPIERLGLMARHGDSWAPIPFQIDQKKPDGSYIFTGGLEATKNPDPKLNALDELVFMIKDTGGRGAGAKLPEGAETGSEIEITDPINNAKGWVYLFKFSGKAPRSGEDYVRMKIDPAKKRFQIITYEYTLGGPMDRISPDFLAHVLPNGEVGPNLLHTIKMRVEVVFVGGITLRVSADKIVRSHDQGWIAGPIRVLRLADGYVQLAGFLRVKGTGYTIVSYFPNHFIWPVVMKAPKVTVKLINKVSEWGFLDFNENIYGTRVFNAVNPLNPDVVLDGHMSEAEQKLDTHSPINWIAGFGPQLAIVNRLFYTPPLIDNIIKRTTYYLDDATGKDPSEDNPRVHGVGYYLTDVEKALPAGAATQNLYFYFKSKLAPEDVNQILDIIDHPVEIKVRDFPS